MTKLVDVFIVANCHQRQSW